MPTSLESVYSDRQDSSSCGLHRSGWSLPLIVTRGGSTHRGQRLLCSVDRIDSRRDRPVLDPDGVFRTLDAVSDFPRDGRVGCACSRSGEAGSHQSRPGREDFQIVCLGGRGSRGKQHLSRRPVPFSWAGLGTMRSGIAGRPFLNPTRRIGPVAKSAATVCSGPDVTMRPGNWRPSISLTISYTASFHSTTRSWRGSRTSFLSPIPQDISSTRIRLPSDWPVTRKIHRGLGLSFAFARRGFDA